MSADEKLIHDAAEIIKPLKLNRPKERELEVAIVALARNYGIVCRAEGAACAQVAVGHERERCKNVFLRHLVQPVLDAIDRNERD